MGLALSPAVSFATRRGPSSRADGRTGSVACPWPGSSDRPSCSRPVLALLALALLLVVVRLGQPDVAANVREFTFGMAAAVVLLVTADFLRKLRSHRGSELRRALFTLPAVVAVIGCTAIAYGVLFGSSAPGSSATILWGAAAMLAAGAGVGLWKYVEGRASV